jgi:hypothetical protein
VVLLSGRLHSADEGITVSAVSPGGGVALASLFYAAAQVQYKFNVPFGPNGVDMAVLLVVLNVSAALLAFASAALCKRQAETSPSGQQQPPVLHDLPRTPVIPTTAVYADAPLAPVVLPAGRIAARANSSGCPRAALLRSRQGEPKMAVFENRSGVYVLVSEHRKRRKAPFAGRHRVNLNRP